MKRLSVIYNGWGERFELGTLADNESEILFEYSAEALARGLELSPHKLPLRREAYGDFPVHQMRLPGMISDALPDGWGALLMDRLFRRRGWRPEQVSPLDRLAFVGDKAIGALVFEPSAGEELTEIDVELMTLALETRTVLEDESEALLLKLALLGGSPHGARPKVLVHLDRASGRMTNREQADGTAMLVKFPAQYEHKEVCAVEVIYNQMAKQCGIDVPRCEYFDLDDNLSAFAIERFDRRREMRIPVHTVSGAAHVDFRVPQLDYNALLRLTQRMTGDLREKIKAYERCVFNVVFNNRDDHSKNFSYALSQDGQWQLSPAYDLTFCEGPGGEHQMDICGEARAPERRHLMQLAKQNAIDEDLAQGIVERICSVSRELSSFMASMPIRANTCKGIALAVEKNRKRLS